jgi:hypothetical protein
LRSEQGDDDGEGKAADPAAAKETTPEANDKQVHYTHSTGWN